MPELPEVETVVRALRSPLIGRTFTGFESLWPNQVRLPDDVDELGARINGRTVTAINRRAKYIVMTLDDGAETLIVHLKMTGHLAVEAAGAPVHEHVRQRFFLADGDELRFRDMRKFGRVYLVSDPAEVLEKLGPEPLDARFSSGELKSRIAHRRRMIKPLLLDQTVIAGIGNIYADESLFGARIRPDRYAHTLTDFEIEQLHHAIQTALNLGIAREGASITNYVKPDGTKGEMQEEVMVFRRTGYPCYVCGTPIERVVLGQRSTHFCPRCQK